MMGELADGVCRTRGGAATLFARRETGSVSTPGGGRGLQTRRGSRMTGPRWVRFPSTPVSGVGADRTGVPHAGASSVCDRGPSIRPGAITSLVLALITALSAVSTAAAADDAVLKVEVGASLPSVVLPDLEGRPRSLAEFRGHRTMLHVFASW